MSDAPQGICLLGATGSVGAAASAVIAAHPQRYHARILVGGGNAERMAHLARLHRARHAVLADETQAKALKQLLKGEDITIAGGDEAVCAAAADATCDTVLVALAGASGVAPALTAAAAGKRLLLANKESLIAAGSLLPEAVRNGGGSLLPVDSEHCALFELLQGDPHYKTLWLTASGGSVRDLPLQQLPQVTPEMALAHPTWSMGRKITIDSATMMNKALEIIEAAVLFNARAEQIGVVIHPQSICHGLVEYADGTLLGNWSLPDMRVAVARMLAWPQRLAAVVPPLGWDALSQGTFFKPDAARYPCLELAYQALTLGGAAPAALSAANEVAVDRFLHGEILFTDIARINRAVLEHLHAAPLAAATLEEVWHLDTTARRLAAEAT